MRRRIVRFLGGLGYQEIGDFWFRYIPSRLQEDGKTVKKGNVIWSHGYRATPKTYIKLLEEIAAEGYDIFSLNRGLLKDRPGTPWGHAAETGKFIDLIVDTYGLDSYHKMGHSLGGYISIVINHYLKTAPTPISATAISPAVRLDDPIPVLAWKGIKLTAKEGYHASKKIPRPYSKRKDDFVEAMSVLGGSIEDVTAREAIQELYGLTAIGAKIGINLVADPFNSYRTAWALRNISYPLQDMLDPIGKEFPIHIIQAMEDGLIPPGEVEEQLVRRFPIEKYSKMPGVDHSSPIKQYKDTAILALPFLKETEQRLIQ